jgi:hypothetical protein
MSDQPPFRIRLDSQDFEVDVRELTGREIRDLPSPAIPPSDELFEELPNGDDRPIGLEYEAEIYSGKVFYTSPSHKTYRLYVNGVEKIVGKKVLTYSEVVRLEFPEPTPGTIYTVSFEKAKHPHEGALVSGQSVEIKDGTEFDVDDTGRS